MYLRPCLSCHSTQMRRLRARTRSRLSLSGQHTHHASHITHAHAGMTWTKGAADPGCSPDPRRPKCIPSSTITHGRNAELTTLSRAVESLQLAQAMHTAQFAGEICAPSVIFESGVRISVAHPQGLGHRQFARQEVNSPVDSPAHLSTLPRESDDVFLLRSFCFSKARTHRCGPGISEQATAHVSTDRSLGFLARREGPRAEIHWAHRSL